MNPILKLGLGCLIGFGSVSFAFDGIYTCGQATITVKSTPNPTSYNVTIAKPGQEPRAIENAQMSDPGGAYVINLSGSGDLIFWKSVVGGPAVVLNIGGPDISCSNN